MKGYIKDFIDDMVMDTLELLMYVIGTFVMFVITYVIINKYVSIIVLLVGIFAIVSAIADMIQDIKLFRRELD